MTLLFRNRTVLPLSSLVPSASLHTKGKKAYLRKENIQREHHTLQGARHQRTPSQTASESYRNSIAPVADCDEESHVTLVRWDAPRSSQRRPCTAALHILR